MIVVCDICGRELERKIVYDYGVPYEVAVSYRAALLDTADVFPHLCLSCATNLDKALNKQKLEIAMEAMKRSKENLTDSRINRLKED